MEEEKDEYLDAAFREFAEELMFLKTKLKERTAYFSKKRNLQKFINSFEIVIVAICFILSQSKIGSQIRLFNGELSKRQQSNGFPADDNFFEIFLAYFFAGTYYFQTKTKHTDNILVFCRIPECCYLRELNFTQTNLLFRKYLCAFGYSANSHGNV